MARSIIAPIFRVGGGASAAERAAGKVLHGKAHTVGLTHLIKHTHLCLRACFLRVGHAWAVLIRVGTRPLHEPVRASLASGTTQTTTTTAQSFLLATGLGGGDKISATFGTFRTATTVATSVAASDLYRGDSSSMAPSVSESSYWDNESSAGSQHHHTVSCHRICVIGSRVRLGTVI